MNKEDIEKLREKLCSLIENNSDYSDILRVSQELDKYIIIYIGTSNNHNSKDGEK